MSKTDDEAPRHTDEQFVRRIFWRRYRIVSDLYKGFEAQFCTWYWPFWRMCFGYNTVSTLEAARRLCDGHNQTVIAHYTPNKSITGGEAVR